MSVACVDKRTHASFNQLVVPSWYFAPAINIPFTREIVAARVVPLIY